jgi:hypothetical protein
MKLSPDPLASVDPSGEKATLVDTIRMTFQDLSFDPLASVNPSAEIATLVT